MSPAKLYYEEQDRRVVMNGPRPSPLRINNLSNVIQKTQSTNSGLLPTALNHQNSVADHKRPNPPVIIYTHSPKVIHAQAREFMALVQRLTGPTHDHDQNKYSLDDDMGKKTRRDEEYDNCGGDVGQASSAVSPVFGTRYSYLADIPLFTPNSTDFLCSPRPLSGVLSASPNTADISMPSPSFLELIKGLPEY